jgi:hypothetical protein
MVFEVYGFISNYYLLDNNLYDFIHILFILRIFFGTGSKASFFIVFGYDRWQKFHFSPQILFLKVSYTFLSSQIHLGNTV